MRTSSGPFAVARRLKFPVLATLLLWAALPAPARPEPPGESRPAAREKYVPSPEELREGYRSSEPFRRGGDRGVYKARITPHWFGDNTRFWYRNDLPRGAKEFIRVDAAKAERGPAFDHAKLAAALSKAGGKEYSAERLPFDVIDIVDDGKTLRFRVGDVNWECDLATYECKQGGPGPSVRTPEARPGRGRPGRGDDRDRPRFPGRGDRREERSPDGKWTAYVKDHNVWVRPREGGEEVPLSRDGTEAIPYDMLSWAPDSKTLVAFRVEPGDRKEVYLIESSPREGGRARLHTRPYALPGDKLASYEMNLFDVEARKQLKPEVEKIDFGRPRVRWKRDGRRFTYEKVDRGHQRFRLIEVDAHTGATRNIIDEKSDTFIWTAHTENVRLRMVNWLDDTDEIIYASERDGWRHLYLIDASAPGPAMRSRGEGAGAALASPAMRSRGEGAGAEGKPVMKQITRGEWVVRGIDYIDEEKRQVWFTAGGMNPDQDPYFLHHYRINFDGTGLVALTEGNGSHSVQFSPDRKYLIDTYSRVDKAPVHELRRTCDGKLVCRLEEADISELKARGWEPPEVFVAKGRDGETDIWGIICRPRNLDPGKLYPVVEQIYAGPQGSFVPKTFSPSRLFSSLTDLGFIVVQIDGMGTANRSKAFHDVCWKNLKDAGFPDRILWHEAVAKKYPYYDITRVGLTGTSAGGQNAAAGVLFHGDFYKAAVAACGCHDNRMDKASWNEQWMGYPIGPQYVESSNIENAHRLRGKLLLIVGEMDTNVPPESTLRFADALIKARKDFDLLVLPGVGHSNGGAYGMRRTRDFFVRHLHGVEPPDWNAPEPGNAGTGADTPRNPLRE